MIYFYCDVNLHFFIDYVKSIQSNYVNVEIVTNINELINTLYNKPGIFLFIQNQPPFDISQISDIHPSKCYLLNTEQLSKEEWVHKLLSLNMNLVDYSRANIHCMTSYKSQIRYLPYMVNRNEIMNYAKTRDVAFIGCNDSSYRMNILNAIPNIQIVEGFGKERDELLFRHKILLNIHFNERYQIFEQMRCNRCILNKMIVITEKSWDVDFELKPYIIECEYGELISMTNRVLENYDYYYHKLFDGFDIDAIEKMYKSIADKTFSNS
jgi:hypothetical protein